MMPQETIRAKRDGKVLSAAQIEAFIAGLTDGTVTEGQVAAFAMAVFFKGMTARESAALTRAMMASGTVLEWRHLDGPVLDKHSTGGVGDTVSLMLAPAVAACGAFVPMISGRGLGHSGGTLDKLESIPRYRAQPSAEEFRRVVTKVGCAIIGQTPDLAPADQRLYAIRDVTATVESIPLITASILSKKLAAGLQGLVMDVKVGSGAFMARMADARRLARSITSVAAEAGLATTALITDMSQPLASVAGNSLEVVYACDYLTGRSREPRMHEVVVSLGAEMLLLGGIARSVEEGRALMNNAIDDGVAAERFGRMVRALGGPGDLLERTSTRLEIAPVKRAVVPQRPGAVRTIDTRTLGMVVVGLGGGRTRPQDPVDHGVGLTELAAIGDNVGPDRPLAIVHARTDEAADLAASQISAAYSLGRSPATQAGVIRDRIVPRDRAL
jgi:thymidine phosphorylase